MPGNLLRFPSKAKTNLIGRPLGRGTETTKAHWHCSLLPHLWLARVVTPWDLRKYFGENRATSGGIVRAVGVANLKGAFLMLQGAIVFFILAIVAAFFGFSGIAASASGIAKILAIVFVVMAVVSFAFNKRVRA